MNEKVDLCDWWTRDRIEAEDAVWRDEKLYISYANHIRDFMRHRNMKSVLEVGCGAGYVAKELAGEFKYKGIDGSYDMIAFANERNSGYDFEAVNIRRAMILQKQSWDLVCSFAVMKHFSLKDWKEVLHVMMNLGKFTLNQMQTRYDPYPSVDSGTAAIVGEPPIPHTWINETELLDAVAEGGHHVLKLAEPVRNVSAYMEHGAEVFLYTQVQS